MKFTEYILHCFKPINFSSLKFYVIIPIASITTVVSSFFESYLGISGIFAISMFLLVVVDHITGTMSAKKRKEKITSSQGLKTVYKAGAYMFFIYMAFQLQNEVNRKEVIGFLDDAIKYFHLYIIVHIFYWELFSVDENLNELGINLGMSYLLKNIREKLKIK